MSASSVSVFSQKTNTEKCASCKKYLRKLRGAKKILQTKKDLELAAATFKTIFVIGTKLCKNCRIKMGVTKQRNREETEKYADDTMGEECVPSCSETANKSFEIEQEYVHLPFPRVVATHRYCFVCHKNTQRGSTVVPMEARMQAFKIRQLFIPSGNRCCREHLLKNKFFSCELDRLQPFSNMSCIEASEVTKFIEALSANIDQSIADSIEDDSLSEPRLKAFTGLTWEALIELRDMLKGSMRNTETRSITLALIIFLFKLRSGASNNIIANVFGLSHDQAVSNYCLSVRRVFEVSVLPDRFGVNAVSRADLIAKH